eukprot:4506237-Amphidinium_carterae.1
MASDLSQPSASAWLVRTVLYAILVPWYLLLGLARLRHGLVTGAWVEILPIERAPLPRLNWWCLRTPGVPCVISFASLVMDFFLPLALIFCTYTGSGHAQVAKLALLLLSIPYLLMTFILEGSNCFQMFLPMLLLVDPAVTLSKRYWLPIRDQRKAGNTQATAGDLLRAAASTFACLS